ncbi:MAG: PLP-dependent aminotransferase family protein [Myxococcaceae bacterium]|jgi:GntR family transcriptional regulator/MocR family aminotransferase|nr:PLP-dependent aminotransferase family protein [Myxococcaceae bacterium]
MSTWDLPLLERGASDSPVFLRIAHAVIDDIRRGRLTPGQRLPGTRAWAKLLGVNRNTVVAAIAEVEAQGWVRTSPTRGTWVEATLPVEPRLGHRPGLPELGVTLPAAPTFLSPPRGAPTTDVMQLSAGTPDPRLFPVELIARTWRRVVRRKGQHLLAYGDPAGHPSLRRALATMVSELRGVPAAMEHVVVTRGSQMALDLVAKAIVTPGDTVAVEALGYRPAWDALRLNGARLVPLPVDAEGLDVEALSRLVRRRRVRAVYVTPHHQYPTTVTMSAARRLALLALARRHGLLIIEDDYDHEFHYQGRPVLPLLASDDSGVVASLGTLSKVLAPGLRLGFVVAPVALAERLTRLRAVMDRQGDHPMEATVAELIEEGELQRHVRKMRVVCQTRRDALAASLKRRLSDTLTFELPSGGISIWATVCRPLALDTWLQRARQRGVAVNPGASYRFDGREPGALRLVFARFTERELAHAVDVLAATAPR